MEIISLVISVFAILISCITLYMQFFYRPRRVRCITLPTENNGRSRFGICNSSKESIYVTGLSVEYAAYQDDGSSTFQSVDTVRHDGGRVIAPGNISEFSYVPKLPMENIICEPREVKRNGGEIEKEIDIVTRIQFAFSTGDVFMKEFRSGLVFESEAGHGSRTEGLNIDLLKGALPVLKPKA